MSQQSSSRPVVFVIHGRNRAAWTALERLLRCVGVEAIDFDDVAARSGEGSPVIENVVREGLEQALAIVALFTPDELTVLDPDLRIPEDHAPWGGRWQPRANVIFEVGMALALRPERTVMVSLGVDVAMFSDIQGRLVLRLANDEPSRRSLLLKLEQLGCAVDWEAPFADRAKTADLDACVPARAREQFAAGVRRTEHAGSRGLVLDLVRRSPAANGEPVGDASSQSFRPTFFAYDAGWVGRSALVERLLDRMHGGCRLLFLVGITGIGKTALGERLVHGLEPWLEGDWGRYLHLDLNGSNPRTDFAPLAASWLDRWGHALTAEQRRSPTFLTTKLCEALSGQRALIQLDSLELLLGGDERVGWGAFRDTGWLAFFEAWLKIPSTQSTWILTSQCVPAELEQAGTRSQTLWWVEPIDGLDAAERQQLFHRMGLGLGEDPVENECLLRIGAAYEGHPLALRIIGGEITRPPFRGDVVAYWQSHGVEIEAVEAARQAAERGETWGDQDRARFRLDRYSVQLRRHVQSRLEAALQRLSRTSPTAYRLLCAASAFRGAVPESFWLDQLDVWDIAPDERALALQALREHFLAEDVIEAGVRKVRQHNLVRSVALRHAATLE